MNHERAGYRCWRHSREDSRLGTERAAEFDSGLKLTPQSMVASVKKLAKDWKYEAVSIGYPGRVRFNRPIAEPRNLAKGWVGFNFEAPSGVR